MARNLVVVALALAILAAVLAEPGLGAIDCNKARSELAPCLPYLTGKVPEPLRPCCQGVQYIKDNTATDADKQTTCQCLKDTAAHIDDLSDSAAQQLSSKCGVAIDVPISKTVDCSKL